MKLIVNGETHDIDVQTVEDVMNYFKIKDKVMAAAVNMEIVKKDSWNTHKIKSEDKVEFLEFVSGG